MGCLNNGTDFLWKKLGISDRQIVIDFFIVFSRFEYALKRRGYLRNGKAEPDWRRFSERNAKAFHPNAGNEIREAFDYFMNHPPEKQVVDSDGQLAWASKPLAGKSDLGKVADAIKRVRNNLFHGGKFPSGPVSDPARASDLLRYSLRSFEAVIELDERVKDAFKDC
jgi:hypothetical protein